MSTCRPLGPREFPRLLTPSSFTDDAGLRPKRRVSALPISHTPILMGGFISGLTYGSPSLQPVDLLAPLVGADQASTQPTGTCTSGLSTVWSPAPPPDITTETTGQFSLAGLSPLERQLASLQPPVQPRFGLFFDCVHSRLPEGCGRTIHCSGCVIRKSVATTFNTGEAQISIPATLNVESPDQLSEAVFEITTVKRDGLVVVKIDQLGRRQ